MNAFERVFHREVWFNRAFMWRYVTRMEGDTADDCPEAWVALVVCLLWLCHEEGEGHGS